MKRILSCLLAFIMLFGLLPGGITVFAAEKTTNLPLATYGCSGRASGTGIMVATGVYPDGNGTADKAPYIEGDTGSQKTNLGSTRIGVMAFSLDGAAEADCIKKAVLHAHVNVVNGNIGAGWLRFAAYETENPTLTYSVGGMDQSLYPAVNNDYSYNAAMWSNEKFTNSGTEGSTSGWATLDVTRAVKNAVINGKENTVLRFQVPTDAVNLSVAGDYAPYIEVVSVDRATVTVNCVDENQNVVESKTAYIPEGESYTASADKYITKGNTVYTLSDDSEKTVTVAEGGNTITFSYISTESEVLAKYEFEDTSFAMGDTVSDSSSGGYDGTVAAGDLASVKGVYGNAVNLNEAGYIELPEALLTAMKALDGFSITAFVKKNELQHQFLFSASPEHLTSAGTSIGIIDAYNYRYESNGDRVTTGLRTEVDSDYAALTTVLDFANETGVLYIDGVEVGRGSITSTLETVGAKVLGIGISPYNDPYYNGYVDNFTIYKSALSAEDVKKTAGLITVTPVYKDSENNREYRGAAVSARIGENVVFDGSVSDTEAFYNFTAVNDGDLTTVVCYDESGSYDYIIDSTSAKNAAFEIADALVIGGECSEYEITLPSSVTGYSGSKVTWTWDSDYVTLSGEKVTFEKTGATFTVTFKAVIEYNGESCTKEFKVLVHANDCTPQQGTRAVDINGFGYTAVNGENLIDISAFDYTCNTYTGWTTGGEALNDNFSLKEGYNDCGGIFAASLGSSSGVGSINPYIPLPEHTGSETFIISFAAYGDSAANIEWSNAFLCDGDKNNTGFVWGSYDGTDYRYGVNVSPDWTVNCFAFTPSADDKYIRLCIGWASNIAIDNISIVKAEKLMIDVSERYVDNTTVYDSSPVVLGESGVTATLQYGENYGADNVPESVIYDGVEYVLVSPRVEKIVTAANGEKDGAIVFDYRYIKAEDAFVHPGVLNTEADLERIAQKVAAGEEPYLSGYNSLINNYYAQIGAPRAVGTIVRADSGANSALLYHDTARAYLCAIRWKISGDTAYADCARDVLNAWSATLKTVTGNSDRYLTGIYAYQLAASAELLRDYPGFERERMQDMLINVFYKPLTERFLYSSEYGADHNDAHIMNYWANWDLCNMAASTAIGVFCDRRDIYERATEYYKYGAGNGSIFNTVPKLYEASEDTLNSPVGQWQEAGRDMEHTQMGVGLMAVTCEIAWNQGDDLYGWANNRFMYGAEYVAQYHLGQSVPYTTYYWYSGKGTWSSHAVLSGKASGIRPVFEMIYNHYKNRKGLEVPGMEALLETVRPEGGNGGSGGHSSSFDQFGFGTLLYTRDEGDCTEAAFPESNVKEGVYRITSRKSGSALTCDSDGYVRQYAVDENSLNQLWSLKDLGGGIYKLTSVATGKAMSIENDSYDLGALITTSDYEGKFSQQFAFLCFDDSYDRYYDGYYRIAPVGSGLSLDVLNASTADGTSVLQYTYNSGSHQQWSLTEVEKGFELSDGDINITVISGNEPIFPQNVTLKNAEGEEFSADVTWKTAGVDFTNNTKDVKSITVTGSAMGISISATVNVYPETFSLEGMYSRNSQSDADTYMNKFPVSITDEFLIEMDVSWYDFGDQWIVLKDSSKVKYFGTEQIAIGFNSSGGFRPVNGNGSGGRAESDVTMKTLSTGEVYRLLIKGDASKDKYTVTLTDPEGEIISAVDYGFRLKSDVIDCISIFTNMGSYDGAFYADNIRVYCNAETVNITVNYTDGENIIASVNDDYVVGDTVYDLGASEAFYIKIGDKAYIAACDAQSHIAQSEDEGQVYTVELSIVHDNAVLSDTYAVTSSDRSNKSDTDNMLFAGSSGAADAPDVDDDGESLVPEGVTNVGSARIPLLTFNIPEGYEPGKQVNLNLYVAKTNANLGTDETQTMKIAANTVDMSVNELCIYTVDSVANLNNLIWSKNTFYAYQSAADGRNPCDTWVSIDVTEFVENTGGDSITFALYVPRAGAYVANREKAVYGGVYEGKAAYLELKDAHTLSITGASRITKNGSKVTPAVTDGASTITVSDDSYITLTAEDGVLTFLDQGNAVYTLSDDKVKIEDLSDIHTLDGYSLGVSMVDGAQVRIGQGVKEDDKGGYKMAPSAGNEGDELTDEIASSGLRFIAVIDSKTRGLASNALAIKKAGNEIEIGIEISAEGSTAEPVQVPAKKYQDENKTVFTAALVNLGESNYNRIFTAKPYVNLNGEIYRGDSVSRSIYEIAAGILVNSTVEGDGDVAFKITEAVNRVLNAYVNQVGIRLELTGDEANPIGACSFGKSGAYVGGKDGEPTIFFEVSSVYEDGIYTVTVEASGNAQIFGYWDEYIRLNNRDVSKYITNSTLSDDGKTLTLKIDPKHT